MYYSLKAKLSKYFISKIERVDQRLFEMNVFCGEASWFRLCLLIYRTQIVELFEIDFLAKSNAKFIVWLLRT